LVFHDPGRGSTFPNQGPNLNSKRNAKGGGGGGVFGGQIEKASESDTSTCHFQNARGRATLKINLWAKLLVFVYGISEACIFIWLVGLLAWLLAGLLVCLLACWLACWLACLCA